MVVNNLPQVCQARFDADHPIDTTVESPRWWTARVELQFEIRLDTDRAIDLSRAYIGADRQLRAQVGAQDYAIVGDGHLRGVEGDWEFASEDRIPGGAIITSASIEMRPAVDTCSNERCRACQNLHLCAQDQFYPAV